MGSNRALTRCAQANYIESMLTELRSMSADLDNPFLVYLLEMAMIEASDIANGRDRISSDCGGSRSAEDLARMYLAGELD